MRRALKAAALLLLLGGVFVYGIAVGHYRIFPFWTVRWLAGRSSWTRLDTPPGRWYPLPQAAEDPVGDDLAGHPYLQGYEPAQERRGAITYDEKRVCPGLTLLCSGHAPTVLLLDREGKTVHEWHTSTDPARAIETNSVHRTFVRRAHVFPNGDLLAVFEYIGLVRLDRDSKELWSVHNRAHHDVTVTADGTIVVLTQGLRSKEDLSREYPGLEFRGKVFDDRVTYLDPEGGEIRSVSILDAFLRSDYAGHIVEEVARGGDVFHGNSVDVVGPATAARYAFADEGDVLVSLRNLDTLALISAETGLIRWVSTGKWRRQHQAQFLPNGNILLFDNQGGFPDPTTGKETSKVLEFDPLTMETRWQFGGRRASTLHSHALGYVRRLPNGNTLITESFMGRILEVAPDGKIVWEYWNPQRAGENDELIATVMGAQRIDPATLEFL